jgi:hypothetical protein
MNSTRWAQILGFLTGFIMVFLAGYYYIDCQTSSVNNLKPSNFSQNYLLSANYQTGYFNPTPFIIVGIAFILTIIAYWGLGHLVE